jgi:hypothetical protein
VTRYVAPVLDPTWQSPYAPSVAERENNLKAVHQHALRRRRPAIVIGGLVGVALLALTVVSWFFAVIGVIVLGLLAYDTNRYVTNYELRANALGGVLLDAFKAGGTTKDRQRLVTVVERLAATFGVDGISAFIVEDFGYNATLVPNGSALGLFVTSGLMNDFELIELEGVVAHLLARHRLGLIVRHAISALDALDPSARRALAGSGQAYRADEVAAAAIRYPLGLAGALRKCARQTIGKKSYFSTAQYDQTRFAWFDQASDATVADLSNLDDVELRAMALEEW